VMSGRGLLTSLQRSVNAAVDSFLHKKRIVLLVRVCLPIIRK